MPRGGTTKDENSPPPEGCRGGLFRREDPPLKAEAFLSPPKRGFSGEYCEGLE
jgi:hypothetical protein